MQQLQCANEPCTCPIEPGEQYCCHACEEDATRGDLSAHGPCRCRHSACEAR